MKAFIQDNERVLNSANDLLKTGVYAENLVKVIENTPKNKVFTIGVFGGWGTGKSSIIRTAQDSIEAKHEKVRFITYDAWKYANDSFRRMFLLKVQQELKMQQTEEMSRFYQSETAEQEPKTVLSAKGLVIGIIVFAVLLALLWLTPLEITWKVGVTTLGTLLSLIVTLLNGCFYDLKVTISKPALFAPEQFEACFKNMMSKCLKERSWINEQWTKLRDYVETGESSVIGLEKLIIVIDNIDRCPSDMAYQLLTDVKTFLSNEEYNLVFIVPVDDEALKKHLFRRWNKADEEEINKEKEEFLRKFFNVTLRIKPHQVTELQHFAHEINKVNNLGFSNDTLAIVAKEFADNPRRIIQLLNNLSGDLALYEDEFATKYETAICAALILHEAYPKFYIKATKDLDVIRKFSVEDKDATEELKSFMRVADVILKRTPLEALQRIFTNTSSIFSDLPTDIQKAVRTFDAAKVTEYAHTNEEKTTNLVDYALESLNTDVKYGATSQTTQWIDFLSLLFKDGVFDSSRFKTIDEALSTSYKTAIPNTDCYDSLCYMGAKMNESGFDALRGAVLEFLKGENASEEDNFENILRAYLTNYTTKQDCIDIAPVVEKYYTENTIDQDFTWNDNQKVILFGDSFVTKQIEQLSASDNETVVEDIIWCIKNNDELFESTYSTLFAKFIELFGATRSKTKEQYLDLIRQVQPIVEAIGSAKLSKEPAQLYDLITKNRGLPHPSYPGTPQHDIQKSILDEVDGEEAKAVVTFCYEITRITGGKVDVSAAISKLYSKCQDTVIEGALKLHKLNISIAPFAKTLAMASNYEDERVLTVLEIILTRQPDGSLMLDEELTKEKIHSLIDNSNIKSVESLLIKLLKDTQILNYVTEYVASLDSETINNLPAPISKYAVSTFKRDNSSVYKDNEDFLILVLKLGKANQKKEVVNLMKAKLLKEEDLEMVVNVLNNLVSDDQTLLKSVVGELETAQNSDSIDKETKKKLSDLATKLSGGKKNKGAISKLFGK